MHTKEKKKKGVYLQELFLGEALVLTHYREMLESGRLLGCDLRIGVQAETYRAKADEVTWQPESRPFQRGRGIDLDSTGTSQSCTWALGF